MAKLTKKQLLQKVETAIRESGWDFLYLSDQYVHPARYQVYRNDSSYVLKVYIWNLTHGGKSRREDEYRIQVTGVERFLPEINGKTLILGWWDETGVFSGFDYTHHSGVLGASPSIQIWEDSLYKASISGLAPHNRGNGEIAIAFRPDLISVYAENLEALHGCGEIEADFDVLTRLGEEHDSVDVDEIDELASQQRQYALVTTKKALRDTSFKARVLTAYRNSCSMCGVQLRLLDAAHILPAAHSDSTDQTSNGISLCVLHHRAYDRSLVTFDSTYRVIVSDEKAKDLVAVGLDGGLEKFRENLRSILCLPPDERDRPAANFVNAANVLRGWLLHV